MSEYEIRPPTKSSLIIAKAARLLEHAGVEHTSIYSPDGWHLATAGRLQRRRALGTVVLERRISKAIDLGQTTYTEQVHSDAAEGYLPVLREAASIVVIEQERAGILTRTGPGKYGLHPSHPMHTTDLEVAQYVIERDSTNLIDIWDTGIHIALSNDLPEPSDDLADAWLKDLGVVAAKAGCDLDT